jgi:hypothetical protein
MPSANDQPPQLISDDLDALLARLPAGAWTMVHDASTDYRVATITIDWRKVPGQTPRRLVALEGGQQEPVR